jgi:hypothetical protein
LLAVAQPCRPYPWSGVFFVWSRIGFNPQYGAGARMRT